MRDLRPEQRRSLGRELHRERYAAYMASAGWRARRVRWHAEELTRTAATAVHCRGCGRLWSLDRDDLHHVDYVRLGDEAHEDLWPMCRSCHNCLHALIESSKSWRLLTRRQANTLALPALRRALEGEPAETIHAAAVTNLREYL